MWPLNQERDFFGKHRGVFFGIRISFIDLRPWSQSEGTEPPRDQTFRRTCEKSVKVSPSILSADFAKLGQEACMTHRDSDRRRLFAFAQWGELSEKRGVAFFLFLFRSCLLGFPFLAPSKWRAIFFPKLRQVGDVLKAGADWVHVDATWIGCDKREASDPGGRGWLLLDGK